MFEEDYCPRLSPDLWKESLDDQDYPETQPLDEILPENSEDESEGIASDETTNDEMSGSDDEKLSVNDNGDGEINPNYDSCFIKKSISELSNTSNSSYNQPIDPVKNEPDIDSEIPGSSETLIPETKLKSSPLELNQNCSSNNNDSARKIIDETSDSDSSESDYYSRVQKKPWITVRPIASLQDNEANVEDDINNSNIHDDSFNEESSSAMPPDRSFSENIENNLHFDEEMLAWLKKHKNHENQWLKCRLELQGKYYMEWEQICMLYHLINTNTMDKWNSTKTWENMKHRYQYLPQRSVKSLINHFDGTLKNILNQFQLPDEVIQKIKSVPRRRS